MPRVCYFTGKKTQFGKKVTHRGKAKYLGGVGTKITGISSRKFRPNIQKVRAVGRYWSHHPNSRSAPRPSGMGLIVKPPVRAQVHQA